MFQFHSGGPGALKFRRCSIDLLAQLPPRREPAVTLYGVIPDVANSCDAKQWQHALPKPAGKVVSRIHGDNESQPILFRQGKSLRVRELAGLARIRHEGF